MITGLKKAYFSSIFSKIIRREIPAEIVYENDKTLVFKDINPCAPIHLLIVPKKEIKSISSLESNDTEYIADLFLSAKKTASLLQIEDTGFRLVVNEGKYGCQTVPHIHIHFIAGKQLGWPPGVNESIKPKH